MFPKLGYVDLVIATSYAVDTFKELNKGSMQNARSHRPEAQQNKSDEVRRPAGLCTTRRHPPIRGPSCRWAFLGAGRKLDRASLLKPCSVAGCGCSHGMVGRRRRDGSKRLSKDETKWLFPHRIDPLLNDDNDEIVRRVRSGRSERSCHVWFENGCVSFRVFGVLSRSKRRARVLSFFLSLALAFFLSLPLFSR